VIGNKTCSTWFEQADRLQSVMIQKQFILFYSCGEMWKHSTPTWEPERQKSENFYVTQTN